MTASTNKPGERFAELRKRAKEQKEWRVGLKAFKKYLCQQWEHDPAQFGPSPFQL